MTISLGRATRALIALLIAVAGLALVPEQASAQPEEKITICHRTNSRTNPYNQMAVAKSGVLDGHASHTGPIFGPDVENWGDIIPPIRPGLPRGLNWNAEGRAILDNGCEMPPDVGPLPSATIGDAACTGTTPSVDVTVSNDPDATDDATFTIRVDGADLQTVGPIAPGDSETVTLTGAPEDQTATIEVVSDGEVVASSVVTADCAPGPPPVTLQAQFGCSGQTAEGELAVTNNTTDPIEVALEADGTQVGPTVEVAPGDTETRDIDVSDYEDETVTASLDVDGTEVASTTITPDCVAPVPVPDASIAGPVCPPPSATVTLSNTGDPDSTVVFGIRVDNRPVQTSAPLYGGDTTTIVVDLTPYEGQTVRIRAGYNGEVIVDRTVTVNCANPPPPPPKSNVTICHRTGTPTNPYDQMVVSSSSAINRHADHTGPVFESGATSWGDIIPPIHPGLPRGLNWNAEGREIADNGCEVPPDVGPQPDGFIGDAGCSGTTPAVDVTVSNAADATAPATFTIKVNGSEVQTVGPIAPGDSETVTLTGAPEDQIATIEIDSGGEVIASRVVTADCQPGPPPVTLQAGLGCAGDTAQGELEVTNNGTDPIEVALLVEGTQVGTTVTVAPGTTETRDIDVSDYEDQTVTATVEIDGTEAASYTITPDCVAPQPEPAAKVAGEVCPPPTATVTLSNTGDPDSTVVFGIKVDGDPVQTSAPLYGGDTTTIVVDLSPYEDQTVHVQAGYNGTVVVDRDVTVDCKAEPDTPDQPGTGPDDGTSPGTGALPGVGADFPAALLLLGLGLFGGGAVLLVAGARARR